MCRGLLAFGLALGLLFAPFSASSEPQPSSVVLSQSEYSQIEAAIIQAQEALKRSNEEIAKQSRDLRTLWIFCGGLVAVAALEATALVIGAIRK